MTKTMTAKPHLSVLWIIGSAFLGAGAIHASLGAATAFAQTSTTPQAPEPAQCVDTQTPSELAAALRDKAARLDARADALDQRQADIHAAEDALQQQLIRLEEAETRLTATLALSERAAEDDLARLTAVYEAMKPADAAILFAEMAPEFAANFLARMNPTAAAGVLSGLEPDQAYAISAFLAGRNAKAIKE